MKLTIVHTVGAKLGTRQSLTSKAVIKLGRRPDNDCVFDHDNDGMVSGYHAEIRVQGAQTIIADLGSTNGTFVNGQRVTSAAVDQHAEVRLGDNGPGFRIEYAAPTMQPAPGSSAAAGAPKNAPAPAPATMEISSPGGAPQPETAPMKAHADPEPQTPQAAPANGPDTAVPSPSPSADQAPTENNGEQDSSDKIYGQRTVGLMIQQALDAAGDTSQSKSGTSKSTEYFEALVDTKVKTTSSKLKWIVLISVFVCITAAAIVGVYLYLKPSQVIQTTQVNYGDAAGSSIAAANRYNVFLIAGLPRSGSGAQVGFCTGFAISSNVLATNAHCVKAAQTKFSSVQAIMNGSSSHRYSVISMIAHPGYEDGSISPDVGLMKIQGGLTNTVTLADQTELSQVAPGAPMFLYGFPGRLNKEEAPEATFIDGDIGRVTAFDQKLGNFGSNTLLQHSAYCTGGTSGSPMFNSAGHVIGINAGGYVENGQALAGYNFGMRIDLINQLLPALR